jgi:enediyne biosynthesis protein E4
MGANVATNLRDPLRECFLLTDDKPMRLLILILAGAVALVSGSGSTASSGIRFEERAARSGLNFTTLASPTPNKNQVETMVAGVALFDYDGDGYLDVYLVNGAAIPSLKKESPAY